MARKKRVSARKRAEGHQVGFSSNTLNIDSDVKMFKVDREGTRRIDLIPYVVKGDDNPEAEKGDWHFERTYYVHRNIGPNDQWYVCPAKSAGKPCPICEYRARLAKDPDSDEEEIKALAPKERQLFNVIDVEDREEGIQLWDYSFHTFGKRLDAEVRNADPDEETEYFPDLEDGLTLKVAFEEKAMGGGRTFYNASAIGFKKRTKNYDKSILDEVYDLDDMVKIESYDKIKSVFLQIDDSEKEEEMAKDPVKEEDSKKGKTRRSEAKKTESSETEFEEGTEVVHEDMGVVTFVKYNPSKTKAKVTDDDDDTHVVDIDELRNVPNNPCKACRGFGKDSKGAKCRPCKGSGTQSQAGDGSDDDGGKTSKEDDEWDEGETDSGDSSVDDFDDWD